MEKTKTNQSNRPLGFPHRCRWSCRRRNAPAPPRLGRPRWSRSQGPGPSKRGPPPGRMGHFVGLGGWVVGLEGQLVGWLVWRVSWLVGWFGGSVGLLVGWLGGWLVLFVGFVCWFDCLFGLVSVELQ